MKWESRSIIQAFSLSRWIHRRKSEGDRWTILVRNAATPKIHSETCSPRWTTFLLLLLTICKGNNKQNLRSHPTPYADTLPGLHISSHFYCPCNERLPKTQCTREDENHFPSISTASLHHFWKRPAVFAIFANHQRRPPIEVPLLESDASNGYCQTPDIIKPQRQTPILICVALYSLISVRRLTTPVLTHVQTRKWKGSWTTKFGMKFQPVSFTTCIVLQTCN